MWLAVSVTDATFLATPGAKEVGIEFVHEQCQTAAEYLWQIIKEPCTANLHNAKQRASRTI